MHPRRPLALALPYASLASLAPALVACGGGSSPPPAAESARPLAHAVFEATAPSVVAILNDDRADREKQIAPPPAAATTPAPSPATPAKATPKPAAQH